MLDNVKNILSQPEIQMLFSENPDVYVKKQVQIRTQRPQITLKHICLFLSFLQTENLLHSVIITREGALKAYFYFFAKSIINLNA